MRNKIEGRRAVGALAGVLALVAAPAAAFGYGIEVPENGGVAFGRAGAFVARASDPSAVMLNPGGLGNLRGFQFTLSTNLIRFDHCFQRTGNYDSAAAGSTITTTNSVFEQAPNGNVGDPYYQAGDIRYPQICKEPSVGLALQALGTYRFGDRFTLGFGIFSPSTSGAAQNFPDRETVTGNIGGMQRSFLAPSPGRYLLFRKQLLVLYPTLAFGARITNWLSAGISAHLGYASYQFGLHANSNYTGPQSPATDVFIGLNASGIFPAFTLGLLATPHRMISIGAMFRYNAPLTASGTANNRFAPYSMSPIESSFTINELNAHLPWALRAGVRFALPRAGRPTQDDGTGRYDPMSDDVFDVEANFVYEGTSNLSETTLVNSGSIATAPNGGSPVPAPQRIAIRSALSNAMGVRLGADYNVIPGRLTVRAGFSYETAGVSPELAQIHLPAYAGVSVHGGLTFRWRWLDVTAGYGHIFYFDNDATRGTRAVTTPGNPAATPPSSAPLNPQGPNPPGTSAPCNAQGVCTDMIRGSGAYTINQGVYSASQNTFNVALGLRF